MMHDVALFVAQCANSKAVLDSLCALVVIPPAAWIAVRLLAREIFRMADDPAWQAPYAAAAASLPGLLFLAIAAFALMQGSSACWELPGGRIVFGSIAALTALAIIRGVLRAIAHHRDIRRLVRCSVQPSRRLLDAAVACGLRARELVDDAPVCALAGVFAPVVLVSSGALRALGDEELKAALMHERAHWQRGDQIIAAFASFLADVLPLPAGDLIADYRAARELAADRSAAFRAGSDALARALIGFAKHGRALSGVTMFSGEANSNIASRLSSLLGDGQGSAQGFCRVRRLVLGLMLAVIFFAGIGLPASAVHRPQPCAPVAAVRPSRA